MVNLDWYRVFLEVAKEKNITKASENLYVSQPAVSKCIKLLEKDLGEKLFVREHKGVTLTEFGKAIYLSVKNSLDSLDSLAKIIEDVKNVKIGKLRIATNTSNIGYILASAIEKFCKKYPNIELKITRINDSNLNNTSYLEQNFDYAFLDEEMLTSNLNVVYKCEVSYDFIGAYDMQVDSIDVNNLKKHNLILINDTYTSRNNIDNYFKQNNINFRVKYEVDNYSMVVSLVKMGLGIGIVNANYFQNEIKNKEIKVLKSNAKFNNRNLVLIRIGKEQTIVSASFEKVLKC
ncbi:MAG: LysR family transcriptional regulator [bacterium]|nr:LysR family transcriptional regulator [bacterium]